MTQQQNDFNEAIDKRIDERSGYVSKAHIKWLIATFLTFTITLIFTGGIMYNQFGILRENMIPKTEYVYLKYRSDYLWAERFDMPLPPPLFVTRGGTVNFKLKGNK